MLNTPYLNERHEGVVQPCWSWERIVTRRSYQRHKWAGCGDKRREKEKDGGRRRHREGRPTATKGEKRTANSVTLSSMITNSCLVLSTRQRDASANTRPQGSRGLAFVLACVEEDAILAVGVVLVARVSCRVGVATSAHINVPLPTNCRYEAVANVLRNVQV
jgi:hypothetical protein